jgi:hypothetical protein
LSERGPARVWFLGFARAFALVEIGAAIWAQASTFVAASARHREGKLNLLADYVVQIQTIITIECDEQIVLGQLSLFVRLQSINRGNIEEIKALVNIDGYRRKTSCAIKLDGCHNPAGQSELVCRARRPGVKGTPF